MAKYVRVCYYKGWLDLLFVFITLGVLFFACTANMDTEYPPGTAPEVLEFNEALAKHKDTLGVASFWLLQANYWILVWANPWRFISSVFLLIPRLLYPLVWIASSVLKFGLLILGPLLAIAGAASMATGAKTKKKAADKRINRAQKEKLEKEGLNDIQAGTVNMALGSGMTVLGKYMPRAGIRHRMRRYDTRRFVKVKKNEPLNNHRKDIE